MPSYYISRRIGAIIEAADETQAQDEFGRYVAEATEDQFDLQIRERQPWEGDTIPGTVLPEFWVDFNSPRIQAPDIEAAKKLAMEMFMTGELDGELEIVEVEEVPDEGPDFTVWPEPGEEPAEVDFGPVEDVRKVYVLTITEGYIPTSKVYSDRDKAVKVAKEYAGDWGHEEESEIGRIYFNQEESGNMEQSVSVEEVELK